MKFDQLKPFYASISQLEEKSIRLILIVAKEEQERKLRIEELEKVFQQNEIRFEKIRLEALELKDLARIEEEILSKSFFEERKLLIIRTTEKMILNQVSLLTHLPKQALVILSLESMGDKFYQQIKSMSLILELKDEKAWQQKERLIETVYQLFKDENKKIAKELVLEMIEAIGLDEGRLRRLVENLICYTFSKQTIEREDLKACLKTRAKLGGWQLVESLLLGEKVTFERLDDSLDPLSVMAQIRFKVQKILKWKGGGDEGYLAEKTKYLAIYGSINPLFFFDLCEFLFELEFSMKNGFHGGLFYLDLIQVKLESLRKRHTPILQRR